MVACIFIFPITTHSDNSFLNTNSYKKYTVAAAKVMDYSELTKNSFKYCSLAFLDMRQDISDSYQSWLSRNESIFQIAINFVDPPKKVQDTFNMVNSFYPLKTVTEVKKMRRLEQKIYCFDVMSYFDDHFSDVNIVLASEFQLLRP